jgi:hypothetical protein
VLGSLGPSGQPVVKGVLSMEVTRAGQGHGSTVTVMLGSVAKRVTVAGLSAAAAEQSN